MVGMFAMGMGMAGMGMSRGRPPCMFIWAVLLPHMARLRQGMGSMYVYMGLLLPHMASTT